MPKPNLRVVRSAATMALVESSVAELRLRDAAIAALDEYQILCGQRILEFLRQQAKSRAEGT